MTAIAVDLAHESRYNQIIKKKGGIPLKWKAEFS